MFPRGWAPDSVIIEGIFLINIAPLAIMKDYVLFLVIPHFAKGVKETHILFDRPAGKLRRVEETHNTLFP